jgi:hypothetical protein
MFLPTDVRRTPVDASIRLYSYSLLHFIGAGRSPYSSSCVSFETHDVPHNYSCRILYKHVCVDTLVCSLNIELCIPCRLCPLVDSVSSGTAGTSLSPSSIASLALLPPSQNLNSLVFPWMGPLATQISNEGSEVKSTSSRLEL